MEEEHKETSQHSDEEEDFTTGGAGDAGGHKPVSKQDSALLHNIKTKGQNAYYYAHAPKNFNVEGAEIFKGDGLIYGGEPVKLGEREKKVVQEVIKEKPARKIAKYSWLDEDKKVKVYIEIDQFKLSTGAQANLTEDMFDIQFQEKSLNIKLVDEEGTIYFLNFAKLSEKIEPEKSSYRLRSNKIIITLHKWLETAWKDLTRA